MPLSDATRIVWAAMFARTNYGQPMPTADEIRRYRTAAGYGTRLGAMVNMVCSDFIESEDDYEMFLDEAHSWQQKLLEYDDLADIFKSWPDKQAVWEASEVAA